MLETTEKTGKKKHDKNEREDWRTVGELLINPLSFFFFFFFFCAIEAFFFFFFSTCKYKSEWGKEKLGKGNQEKNVRHAAWSELVNLHSALHNGQLSFWVDGMLAVGPTSANAKDCTTQQSKRKPTTKPRHCNRVLATVLFRQLSRQALQKPLCHRAGCFTQLAQSHGVSGFPAARPLSDLQIFCWKSSCRLLEYKQTFFGVVVLVFVRLFQPVCATLALFRFVSASFTLTTITPSSSHLTHKLFFYFQ